MVYFGAALAVMLIPLWILRCYEKEFIRKNTKSNDIFRFLYPVGLYIFDQWYRRYGRNSRQVQWAEAVYVYDTPQALFRMRGAKRIAKTWLCLIAAVLIGICLSAGGEYEREKADILPRPGIGETESYNLEVTGIEEHPMDVTVTVSGVQPEDEELQQVFDKVFEHVTEQILGDNVSTEEIRSNLQLISVTDYGIRVQWESMTPELISSSGRIAAEDISEEGELAVLRATLSYGTYQAFYDLGLHVFPNKKDSAYYYGMLLSKLDEEDKTNRKSKSMKLPEVLEEKKIQFFYQKESRPWILLFLAAAAGILLFAADCENMKKEYTERNQQLLQDYPSILFKLSIMLGCGITLRGAWTRIIEGYQQQRNKNGMRYVYEEMITVQRHIDAGDGEAAAYQMFGKRCGEDCYQRLGTYLEQNVRQGVSGMQAVLETEMSHALEERRHLALRMGEAMNTKLLLPMVLMLGVVVVVLMAPAMLSM